MLLSWVGWQFFPDLPFMNRIALVVFASLGLPVVVSLARPARREVNHIVTEDVSYATPASFDIASLGVILILIALCATYW